MEMQKHSGPRTLRGVYSGLKRDGGEEPLPSLKGLARSIVKQGPKVWAKVVVDDAERWLSAKAGGTPAERKARADRRKERRSTNLTAKLARKGKGKLKPSGEGSEKKGKKGK